MTITKLPPDTSTPTDSQWEGANWAAITAIPLLTKLIADRLQNGDIKFLLRKYADAYADCSPATDGTRLWDVSRSVRHLPLLNYREYLSEFRSIGLPDPIAKELGSSLCAMNLHVCNGIDHSYESSVRSIGLVPTLERVLDQAAEMAQRALLAWPDLAEAKSVLRTAMGYGCRLLQRTERGSDVFHYPSPAELLGD